MYSSNVMQCHVFIRQNFTCTLLYGFVADKMSRAVDALMATFKPVVEDHQFDCWKITATKCHILESEGPERQKYALDRFVLLCCTNSFWVHFFPDTVYMIRN